MSPLLSRRMVKGSGRVDEELKIDYSPTKSAIPSNHLVHKPNYAAWYDEDCIDQSSLYSPPRFNSSV